MKKVDVIIVLSVLAFLCLVGLMFISFTSAPRPRPRPPPPPLSSIITKDIFNKILWLRDEPRCEAVGFYNYSAFMAAAARYPDFGNTGSDHQRRREIAAFFAHTSHMTTAGIDWIPPIPASYGGYCYKAEQNPPSDYCHGGDMFPCAPGKSYHGRGPFMIQTNWVYGFLSDHTEEDLVKRPELVDTDPVISFTTAIGVWILPRENVSCHKLITGLWTPTSADEAAGRLPGFGITSSFISSNIIFNKWTDECRNSGPDPRVEDRIGFYKRYCGLLGVDYGDNLNCYNMTPFAIPSPAPAPAPSPSPSPSLSQSVKLVATAAEHMLNSVN